MRLAHPFLEDYHVLCPCFLLPEAERVVAEFKLPKMVQVAFYSILLNEVVELGVVRGFMAEGLKSCLRWSCFEAWIGRIDHELREAQLRRQTTAV